MQPLVEVRDLRYRYDDGTVALDGVDFQLFPEKPWPCSAPMARGRRLSLCT